MTSLLRALSPRARVLSLNCSLFVALTLARRAFRPRPRPARSRYAHSGFRRFTCLLMVAVIFVQFVLVPPQVSHTAVKAISATAVNYGQDTHLWWRSSGWAAKDDRLRNEYLPNIGAQAQPRGWDGKGSPRSSRPAPQALETQQDREGKVARVKIFPGDVEVKTGEQIIFNAIAFDQDDNPVGGLEVKWDALDEGKNQPLTISTPGTFVSGVPGRFTITAEIAGRREQVKAKVTGEPRRPNLKSRSEAAKSSHESRRVSSLRAPVQGDQKRIAMRSKQAGMPALPGFRTASAPMAARPVLQATGGDQTGWNSSNNDTMDDVGGERGHVPGRVVDGGVGSGNFQLSAPAVVLGGRGIDLSLLFHQNSRVWHKAGSEITHDIDRDTLVPGWNLGLGKIVMAGDTYFLIDSDGTRHPYNGTLRSDFPAPATSLQTFEGRTTDGTFIDFYAEGYKPEFDNSGGRNMIMAWAALPNGTRIEYGAPANYAMYPTRITDAHGNVVTITYRNNQGPQIHTITDTLGRAVYFHYDGSGLLTSIVVPGLNGGARVAVRLQYQWLTLSDAGSNYGFAAGLTTKVRQNTIPVVKAIYYPGTATGYWFGEDDSYSPYGMIRKVSERRGMTFDDAPLDQQGNIGAGAMSRELVYNYPQSGGSLSDAPTYTQMTEDWFGRTTSSAPVTTFSVVVRHDGLTRETTITRPDGVQVVQTVSTNPVFPWTYGMSGWTRLYRDGSLLRQSKTDWEIAIGYVGGYGAPRPRRTEATDERGRTTVTLYNYDPNYGSRYNAPTDVRVYGYGGELLRRMHTEYLNDGNYNGALQNSGTLWWKQHGGLSGGPIWIGSHVFNLVSVTEVYAGDDATRLSRTEYQYDGRDLTDNPGMAQHNIAYNPYAPDREVCEQVPDPNDPDCNGLCPEFSPDCDGICPYVLYCYPVPQYDWRTGYRGNVTQIKRYADAASLDQGTAVVETRTYDVAGNVREQTTSCCEKTTFNYTTNTQYAWPESQTSGSPSDQNKQNTASATYDYSTGLVLTSTDAQGRVSDTEYDPNTLRPVRENLPTDAYQYHIYDDLNLKVEDYVYEAGQSGPNVASRSDKYLDGLGRVVEEVAFGKDYAPDVVETQFDNLGRVWRQTRPYRAGAETPQWSVVAYDSLDRPVKTTSPDGSVASRAYNQSPDPPSSSGQPGPTVKVTDPWGRERWARSDALGRLVEVAEPNPGGNGSLSGGAMYTTYSYDALDRLLQVNQGAQTRRFRYDSLGRLTHQKLAERDATLGDNGQWVGAGQWSDVFFYDTRSNLVRRVDARGVQTHYDFNDPLNRLLEVRYDKSGSPAHLSNNIFDAPTVNYAYMTSGDKRRAATVTVGSGMGNERLSYDNEGRLSRVRQTFTGRADYPLETDYAWDSLARLKYSDYPKQYGAGDVRKKIEPAYDIASRIDSLKFGGVTYASKPVYNAASQTTSLDVGGQIAESYKYDPKNGLMTGQQVKRGADLLVDLKYNYTTGNDPDNNGAKTGQLTSLTDLKNQARNRAYEYDKLGRLSKVKGGADAFDNPAWHQSHSYDRYGNRNMIEQNGEAVWVDDAVPAGATQSAGYPGLIVSLRSWHGYYVRANNGGGSEVSADAAAIGPHEQFTLNDLNGGALESGDRVQFLAYDRIHYLGAQDGGAPQGSPPPAGRVHAGSALGGPWETFTVRRKDGASGPIGNDTQISLQSYRGYNVAAESGNGEMNANRTFVQDWETFTLVMNGSASTDESWTWASGPNQSSGSSDPIVSLRSWHGYYVRANNGGGSEVYADAAAIGTHEQFTLIDLNGGALESGDRVQFLAYDRIHYLGAQDGGAPQGSPPPAGRINAGAIWGSTWETFTVRRKDGASGPIGNGAEISLQSDRGFNVAAEIGSGEMNANRTFVQDWETFTLVIHDSTSISGLRPYSGAASHQSAIAPGLHQHWFYGASQTLQVNAGDRLYTYIYLDPANTPSEVMLQWYDGSWEHRAYWGANNIGWGTDGTESRRYMGPLPAAGGWVRLEVPASAVGVEGKTLNGMAFTLYGGRAWWDKTGKTSGTASSVPLDGLANIGYSQANNRINSPGFEYDPAGNQTRAVVDASGRQQAYWYDCAGRLVYALDINGRALMAYAYGAGNQRLMSVEGGVTKYFAWDGGKIIAEYEASGANALVWKTSYVYLGGQLLATTSGAGGTETRFHHPDRLGTRLVTDAGGAVVSEQLSMPFGTMLPFTQVYGGENSYQNPTLGNPSKKRFTTYDRSEATGLDYAVNRFYSPQQGRFTQVDPIGMSAAELANPQSLNLYAYVENDPVNSSDPLGLDGMEFVFRPFPVPPGGGGGGGGPSIGPFSFSFSFGGGSFLNFGSLQQPKKKQQTGGGIKRDGPPEGVIFVDGVAIVPPDIGVKVGGGGGVPGASNASDDEILDALQHTLDTIGLVPGFGEPADFLSAVMSAGRGDYVGVTLSLAAMIPIAGMLATYAKFARGAKKAARATKGDDGLHVALGLTQDGRLFKFAEANGFKTYFDITKSNAFDPDAFTKIMQRADSIHFNTQGFDFARFGQWAHRDGQLWMMRGYSTVTNYELREVLTIPAFKGKLVFH
jgi:RHS repeat-associated protein